MPMEPGQRDRAVSIQQADDDTGTSGFPRESWFPLVNNAWMSKRDIRGEERWKTDQIASKFDSIFEMGYRADMDPELLDVPKLRRLVYQDRIYQIVSATLIGRREGVQLATVASTKVT
jgi:hypothetical protein